MLHFLKKDLKLYSVLHLKIFLCEVILHMVQRNTFWVEHF